MQQQKQARSRLQFVFDLAHATFSQEGLPTPAQIDALRRTLSESRRRRCRRLSERLVWPWPSLSDNWCVFSVCLFTGQVPLEELGMQQEQQEVASSSSSRSSSPGLMGGGLAAAAAADQQSAERGAADDVPRPPITYLLIYEDSRVSLGIFCLPARARIPLHNHPGMTVLSRCAPLGAAGSAAGCMQCSSSSAALHLVLLPQLAAAAPRAHLLQYAAALVRPTAHLAAARPSTAGCCTAACTSALTTGRSRSWDRMQRCRAAHALC